MLIINFLNLKDPSIDVLSVQLSIMFLLKEITSGRSYSPTVEPFSSIISGVIE